MSTSVNCPNCGSTLAPGATVCARCGHQLAQQSAADPAPQPAATEYTRTTTPTAAPSPAQIKVNFGELLADARERWGIEQTPYFTAGLIAAGIALLLGTIGHSVFLTAKSFTTQSDGQAWLTAAVGMGFVAAALMVLTRWSSGSTKAGSLREDLRVSYVLGGLALVWIFLALVFGFFDNRLDPEYSWSQYAVLFAILDLTWCAISRPIPESLGSMKAVNIGLGGLAASGVTLLIGMFLAMSNKLDTYSRGVTLQDLGYVLAIMSFALFLGLAPRKRGA